MNLQNLYSYILYVINKEQSGSLTPNEFNTLLQVCNLKHFKRKIGLPEEYNLARPIPQQAWEITEKLTEDMKKFLVVNSLMQVNSEGVLNLPSDYYYISSIGFEYVTSDNQVKRKAVQILKDHEVELRRGDAIKFPSKKNPVAVIRNTYIQFYPIDLARVSINYLRLPTTPVYAFTMDINDNVVYDAANSKELEWDDINIIDIAGLILEAIGINLQKTDLQAYANKLQVKGI